MIFYRGYRYTSSWGYLGWKEGRIEGFGSVIVVGCVGDVDCALLWIMDCGFSLFYVFFQLGENMMMSYARVP